MNAQRSLALDLYLAGPLDRAAVTRLVADHAVAPARRVWSLPAPMPGETDPDLVDLPTREGYGPGWAGPLPELVVSTALFDPCVVGFVLFSRLFPGVLLSAATLEDVIAAPEWIYFEHSRQLAVLRHEDVERLVGAAFGDPLPARLAAREGAFDAVAARHALQELAEAQAMVRRALEVPRPAEPPLLLRQQIGLRHVDEAAAGPLDAVLRADVHQRAVWFSRVDILIPIAVSIDIPGERLRIEPAGDDEDVLEQVQDHGVYPTQVPESVRGAVALDLVRTFPRQREIAACSHCAQPVILTPHQVGRADKGEPVYHPDCTEPARRRWMRDYQRRRRIGALS